jgi:hypothetical protein
MNYIYWSEAALALADRQTRDMSEGKANELLRRRGNYRNPSTGELFPFPAPEPSNEMLEKFPVLATMPRDSNAKSKLLHSRAKEYENILLKLADAGEIIFYDPASLLRIRDASEVKDPMLDMDKVAAQIEQYNLMSVAATPALTQQPAPATSADWIAKARDFAKTYIDRHKEQDLFPSQDDVCKKVQAYLRENRIFGSHSKPLSAGYILRNAIQGEWWQHNKP